jgi:hypothetical protein
LSEQKDFMFKIRFGLLFLLFACSGCKKENKSAAAKEGLNGRWKMTAVLDKNNQGLLSPPAGADAKVFLEFDGDSFSGKTMKNTISNGILQVNKRDSITFGSYHSTLVAEDQWGGSFMTMLSSCMLQSYYPCRPSAITWKSQEKIEINTAMRYIITLEKF